MSQESLPKLEKKSLGLTKALALAIPMILQAHSNAEALEIPTGIPWAVAVQKNIKESAKMEKNEHGFTYLKFSDQSGKWLPTTQGISRGIRSDLTVECQYISNIIKDERIKGIRSLDTICWGHTHPSNEINRTLPRPPSPEDINTSSISAVEGAEVDSKRNRSSYKIKVKHFVADVRGVWYYSKADGSRYKPFEEISADPEYSKAEKRFYADYRSFISSVAFEPVNIQTDLSSRPEYMQLQQSYRANLSANVRFVPYYRVKNEPACAVTEYNPNK